MTDPIIDPIIGVSRLILLMNCKYIITVELILLSNSKIFPNHSAFHRFKYSEACKSYTYTCGLTCDNNPYMYRGMFFIQYRRRN